MIFKRVYKLAGVSLTKENITKLHNLFSKYMLPTIDVIVEDDKKYIGMNLQEFLDEDFTNIYIENITMSGNDYKNDRYFELKREFFEDDIYSICISSSNESDLNNLGYEIEQWIKNNSTRGKKRIVTLLEKDVLLFALYSVFFNVILLVGIVALQMKYHIENQSYTWLSLCGTIWGYFALQKTKKIFPYTEINFGYNKARTKRKYIWQFITIIVIPTLFMIVSLVIQNI